MYSAADIDKAAAHGILLRPGYLMRRLAGPTLHASHEVMLEYILKRAETDPWFADLYLSVPWIPADSRISMRLKGWTIGNNGILPLPKRDEVLQAAERGDLLAIKAVTYIAKRKLVGHHGYSNDYRKSG